MKQRLVFIAFFTVFLATTAYAQSVPLSVGSLNLSASSNNPAPGDQVTITATSYTDDLNSSDLVWTVNGAAAKKGMGATSLTVTAPALGKRVSVAVSAITSSGTQLNDSLSIGSGEVDLILEPSGYVPPFFPGKADPSYQNSVTIVAIPHLAKPSGSEYDPASLVYQWKQNGSVIQDQSGYGKQSITIDGSLIPRPYTINVTATTQDGSAQAEGYISVSPSQPSVVFYSNDPLYGPLYNKAFGSTVRIGSQKETDVLAVPYGFDKPADGIGGLSFAWSINGLEHPELASDDSITLRAPDGQSGSSNIALSVTSIQRILQGAQDGFSASFAADAAGQIATTSNVSF